MLEYLTRYDGNENPVLSIAPEGNAEAFSYDERDLLFQTARGQLVAPPEIIAVTRTGDVLDLGTLDLDSGQSASSTPFFRYENGSWIYNLSTQGFLPGTYQIDIQMPDGIVRSAGFVLR